MKGIDRVLFYAILSLTSVLGWFIVSPCFKLYSELITFLSILIGFQITSISILFNSRILNVLYSSKNKVYQTDLHKLKAYFNNSIYFCLLSVVVLLLLPTCFNFTIRGYNIFIPKSILVLPILGGSTFGFIKISNELFRIFLLPRNE